MSALSKFSTMKRPLGDVVGAEGTRSCIAGRGGVAIFGVGVRVAHPATSERRTALAMKPLTLLLRRIAHAGWQTAQQVRWKRAPAWNDRWGADRRLAGDADHGRLPRHDRRLTRLCRRLGDRGRYGRGGRRRNHA